VILNYRGLSTNLDFFRRMRTHFWSSIFFVSILLDGNLAKSAESGNVQVNPSLAEEDDMIPHSYDSGILSQFIKGEGGLIHNVFKLMRLEIAIVNAIEERLHTRVKRAKKSSHSYRFDDIQSFVDDKRGIINSQIKAIKQVRKIWKGAKALPQGSCESRRGILALIEVHPKVVDQIVLNGDILADAISKLESEKNGLLSRKMNFGQIISDSPQRLADLALVQKSLKKEGTVLGSLGDSLKKELEDSMQACTSDESISSSTEDEEDSDPLDGSDD